MPLIPSLIYQPNVSFLPHHQSSFPSFSLSLFSLSSPYFSFPFLFTPFLPLTFPLCYIIFLLLSLLFLHYFISKLIYIQVSKFSTSKILCYTFPCGNSPRHYKTSSSIFGLCSLDARSKCSIVTINNNNNNKKDLRYRCLNQPQLYCEFLVEYSVFF